MVNIAFISKVTCVKIKQVMRQTAINQLTVVATPFQSSRGKLQVRLESNAVDVFQIKNVSALSTLTIQTTSATATDTFLEITTPSPDLFTNLSPLPPLTVTVTPTSYERFSLLKNINSWTIYNPFANFAFENLRKLTVLNLAQGHNLLFGLDLSKTKLITLNQAVVLNVTIPSLSFPISIQTILFGQSFTAAPSFIQRITITGGIALDFTLMADLKVFFWSNTTTGSITSLILPTSTGSLETLCVRYIPNTTLNLSAYTNFRHLCIYGVLANPLTTLTLPNASSPLAYSIISQNQALTTITGSYNTTITKFELYSNTVLTINSTKWANIQTLVNLTSLHITSNNHAGFAITDIDLSAFINATRIEINNTNMTGVFTLPSFGNDVCTNINLGRVTSLVRAGTPQKFSSNVNSIYISDSIISDGTFQTTDIREACPQIWLENVLCSALLDWSHLSGSKAFYMRNNTDVSGAFVFPATPLTFSPPPQAFSQLTSSVNGSPVQILTASSLVFSLQGCLDITSLTNFIGVNHIVPLGAQVNFSGTKIGITFPWASGGNTSFKPSTLILNSMVNLTLTHMYETCLNFYNARGGANVNLVLTVTNPPPTYQGVPAASTSAIFPDGTGFITGYIQAASPSTAGNDGTIIATPIDDTGRIRALREMKYVLINQTVANNSVTKKYNSTVNL